MKGISAIIATLLLLVITMGLAVTAYFYVNSLITQKTGKSISVDHADCISAGANNQIVIVLTNIGNLPIESGDIKITLGNQLINNNAIVFNPSLPIQPRNTTVASYSTTSRGPQTLLVTTPSGTSSFNLICP